MHFLDASPFPHLYLGGLIPTEIVSAAAAEFDRLPAEAWHVYDGAERPDAGKRACRDRAAIRRHAPTCDLLLCAMTSPSAEQLLCELTGQEGLVADSTLYGAGLHGLPPGAELGVHLDNELHPELGLMRRLNLILYLSPAPRRDGRGECGGALRLWDRTRQTYRALDPWPGALALVECGAHTWHSVGPVPAGPERRSLAVYYWSPPRRRARFLARAVDAPREA